MKLQYGSLFAGVGGFDMGMEQAGYEPVFQVEWDKNCQKILHHHWPTVPKWGDVCDVNGADLPPCDVLIFGSPCQDLSIAGKRAGITDGERSVMFFEAVRIIKEMRDATNSIYPRATIWENVPGALSSNKGADFGVVLSTLADIGAITQEYAVLDSINFRVPQRRRRIFLVSIFDPAASDRCPDPLLPLVYGSRGDFAKKRKARQDYSRTVEESSDSLNGKGYRMLAFGHYADDDTASALKMRDYKDATDLVLLNNEQMPVRRLSPLEHERLMGWPDDHTRWTADGKEQADTNRYKQCGNGVVTPVAAWVAKHLKGIL